MEKMKLDDFLRKIIIYPHPETNKGQLYFADGLISNGRFNARWHPNIVLDLTGNLYVGKWTMFGEGTKIFTHDHYHQGRTETLLARQERLGVYYQKKFIGNDVWIHGAIILCQVTSIPDGVVIGAGSVLTKNPRPYEIWAGNPAKKIGERK